MLVWKQLTLLIPQEKLSPFPFHVGQVSHMTQILSQPSNNIIHLGRRTSALYSYSASERNEHTLFIQFLSTRIPFRSKISLNTCMKDIGTGALMHNMGTDTLTSTTPQHSSILTLLAEASVSTLWSHFCWEPELQLLCNWESRAPSENCNLSPTPSPL